MASIELNGLNAAYVAELLQDYLDAPGSVAPEWRRLFETDQHVVETALPGLAALMPGLLDTVPPPAMPEEAPPGPAPASPPVVPAAKVLAVKTLETGAVDAGLDETNAATVVDPVPAAREVAEPELETPSEPASTPPDDARGVDDLPVDERRLAAVAAAMALVKAIRMHGHLAARLDPLGSEPMGDATLDETRLQPALTPEVQAQIPGPATAALRSRRDPAGGVAEPARRLLRLDRVRDRAHLRPCRACLVA